MEVSILVITTLFMAIASLVLPIYRLMNQVEVLQSTTLSCIEDAASVEDSMIGFRHVIIASLQSEVDELKREVADLKKHNKKCLKHGDSPCGNGHTA